jgi:hypothetical protein
MILKPEMIIALCALGLTLYQAWLTRRHNRLSVMPHLDWNRAITRTNEGVVVRFLLKNSGVGPAIIRSRVFLFNGSAVATHGDVVEELATRCFADRVPHQVRHHSLPGIGSIMPAGQELCVAEVFFPGLKRPQELEISGSLKDVDFVVVYESFYRERFTFSTADDDVRKSAGQ